jgi:predicted aspartyl protease
MESATTAGARLAAADAASGAPQRETGIAIYRSRTRLTILAGNIHASALIDTGASISAMSLDVWSALHPRPRIIPSEVQATGAGQESLYHIGSAQTVSFRFEGEERTWNFLVIPNLLTDVVLGWDFLQHVGAYIDCRNETLHLPQENRNATLRVAAIDHPVQLFTAEAVRIEPGCEKVVRLVSHCRLPSGPLLVTGVYSRHTPVAVAQGITEAGDDGRELFVILCNPHENAVRIKPRTTIAVAVCSPI